MGMCYGDSTTNSCPLNAQGTGRAMLHGEGSSGRDHKTFSQLSCSIRNAQDGREIRNFSHHAARRMFVNFVAAMAVIAFHTSLHRPAGCPFRSSTSNARSERICRENCGKKGTEKPTRNGKTPNISRKHEAKRSTVVRSAFRGSVRIEGQFGFSIFTFFIQQQQQQPTISRK